MIGQSRRGGSATGFGLAMAGLGMSVSILVGVGLWWAFSHSRVDVGTIPWPQADPAAQVVFDPGARIEPSIVVRSARLADRWQTQPAPAPVRILIPAIGVRSVIVPVGVDPQNNSLEIPKDVRTVGWYRYGPSPGQPGSAVLVGHVDTAEQGSGPFLGLRDLGQGAIVTVRYGISGSTSFRVVARRQYPKGSLPAGLFAESGRPILALITCGGAFDQATRHYADNVVVYATFLSSSGGVTDAALRAGAGSRWMA